MRSFLKPDSPAGAAGAVGASLEGRWCKELFGEVLYTNGRVCGVFRMMQDVNQPIGTDRRFASCILVNVIWVRIRR
jgi:hypothetical protein